MKKLLVFSLIGITLVAAAPAVLITTLHQDIKAASHLIAHRG
jgi:hypothetical protein